ncbi:MAG: gamma-glutamylcyclotransferase [Rhodobacterales bacterium]|nr:gamma-glutamylcyclotransferase [Rhodobacterales bacterium]
MPNLFFYGTLRHLPLLSLVLGPRFDTVKTEAARLSGFKAIAVPDQSYPLLIEQIGAEVEGIVVQGLQVPDIARLDFYEGGFDFELCDVEVSTLNGPIACQVYRPTGVDGIEGAPWSFDHWAQKWALMSEFAAREAMGYFGHMSAAQLGQKFPMIRARATSRILAQNTVPMKQRRGFDAKAVENLGEDTNYVDYFLSKTIHLRHPVFSGGQGPELRREVFVASDAAIVLPYDPLRDRVLLVEQFRMGGRMGVATRIPGRLNPWRGVLMPGKPRNMPPIGNVLNKQASN